MESDRVEITVDITDKDRIQPILSAIRAYYLEAPDDRWWSHAASVIEREGTSPGTISVTATFDLYSHEVMEIEEKDFPALVATIREANGADCLVWMDIAAIHWITRRSDDEVDMNMEED